MTTSIATTQQSVTGLSSIAGVASGLHFDQIVSQLMAVEQQKVTDLQTQQSGISAQQTAMNTLQGYLTTLQTQAQSMADSFNFLSYTGSLTSALNGTTSATAATAASSLVSVQGSSSATAGTHTVVVKQLAQAEKEGSSGAVKGATGTATSDTVALGLSGSFKLDGQTVSVSSTDSLQTIASSINALDSGSNATGVTASVMQVGTNDYRLVLTNDATGATTATNASSSVSAITLSSTTTSGATVLGDLSLSAPTSLQTAQDATATIDGYKVTNSSNTLSNAISGVTLNLLGADSGTTVTVNVGVDTQTVTQNIQSFVDDYNKVMDFINQQKTYNSTTKTSGPLAADPLVSTIQSQLSSMMISSIPGLSSSYNSAVLIGVTPDSTGDLSIDTTTLNSVLASDPNAVKDVFAATGSSANSALSFISYGSNTTSGSYAVNITQAAKKGTVTGTKSLTGTLNGTGTGTAESVTVTDGSGQQVVVNLSNSDTLSNIVSTLNSAFSTTQAQQYSVSGLTAGTTSATTMSSLGYSVGDTISITGATKSGSTVNSTYTVASGDTVATLLSAIQYAYGQNDTATIDSSGNIVLTDNSTGQSSMSFGLTYNGSTGLSFNTSTKTVNGQSALALTASASGNNLQITANNYASGFTISQSTNLLGITNNTYPGQSVAGNIGGYTATGSGQFLTGTSGSVSGMVIQYSGTATGSVGTMTASLGIGAQFDNALNTLSTPITGLVATDLTSMQTSYDNLSQQIADVKAQMSQEQATLLTSFQAMESSIASLNSSGQYLTQLASMASSSFK